MNIDTFKKVSLYYFEILGTIFTFYIILLLIFSKQKPHIIELCIISLILFITCLGMGGIGSYLAKQESVMYTSLDRDKTIEMVSNILNKAGYSCGDRATDKSSGEFIYTSTSRNTKFYGNVSVFMYKDAIEVKAPRILYLKYLNKMK